MTDPIICWRGSAQVWETNRANTMADAVRARESGNEKLAAELEGFAEKFRQYRDDEQRKGTRWPRRRRR